jgi:two-component system nitrogen regulation response regulator GlnG
VATLLVVDDEPSICWGLSRLGEKLGHCVHAVSSAEQALELVRSQPVDVVLLDVRLPGMDGLTAIAHLRQHVGHIPIIVITAYGDLQTAVHAVQGGAFEYLVKPFDVARVQSVLERALESGPPAAAPSPEAPGVGGFVGRTAVMQEAFHQIALAAAADASVLLQGESGTGKELAARAIHTYSNRSQMPFVVVNVAALSTALAESELFGHVKGAFTGAEQSRRGLLARADGGTLFLDEIADIPLPVQVKLLRALEHGEITPVGSDSPVRTNFRVISATHQDLSARVQAGTFRHDLYFRIAAFRIVLPPLRERQDDILLLSEHFLDSLRRPERAPCRLTAAACQELLHRPWHGNVRELRNAIEHAVIVARGGTIGPEHLPAVLPALAPVDHAQPTDVAARIDELLREWAQCELLQRNTAGDLYNRLLAVVEPPLLDTVLQHHAGQCAAAARALGLHRTTLRKKLDQYQLSRAADSDQR